VEHFSFHFYTMYITHMLKHNIT